MAAQDLINTKQDVISAIVQRELTESASLIQNCRDLSSLAVKGVKQIELPKLSQFTVQDRAFGAAASENAALTDSTDVVALDKNKIVLFGYDAKSDVQSTVAYLTEAIRRASTAHGRQINDDILAEWDTVAGLNLNGGAPADITVDDILDMREFLMVNFADMGGAKLVIAADQEKAILKLDEFRRFDYRGDGTAPVVNGVIGSVYGIPVQLNQQIGAQQAYMVHAEGCGFAFQSAPSVAQDDDLTYGTGGKQVAVDVLYGIGGLQLGEGTAAASTSPFIAKLKN